jgi:outer membrane receptor for Fe3+-dicitrate
MNAIIKNSDKIAPASAYFVARGLPKVKVRLTIDHTTTDLNQQSYSPAFSYPSSADALRRVTPDCYMCVGDI